MHRLAARRASAGFSLIELMVVVSIIAIGLGLALPELSGFARRNQISSATNDLLSAINLARTEAIKRGASVVICASNNSTTAAPSCGGNWEQGSIVFVDTNTNGSRQTAEEIVRVTSASPANVTIQLNSAQTQIRFAPNGMLNGAVAGARFQVANTRSPSANENRYICIARGGRAVAMNNDTFLNDPRFSACGN